ncbi:MAG: hypothetical protein ACK5Q5_18980 [Planctomycetaceae bacterium]
MPATGKAIIGKLCKAYIDVDGDIAGPTWVEAPKIQGLSKTSSRNLAEIAERGEDDVLVLPSHINREISFELTRRPGDTVYDTLENAFEDGTKVGVAIMTGGIAVSGSRGYQAEVYVTQFDDDQGHEGTTVSVTVRPAADYTTAPAHVAIA